MTADPSHGTGRRDKVAPMALASAAAGADAMLIEVHHQPDKALSDGAQSLYPEQFAKLMDSSDDCPASAARSRKLLSRGSLFVVRYSSFAVRKLSNHCCH